LHTPNAGSGLFRIDNVLVTVPLYQSWHSEERHGMVLDMCIDCLSSQISGETVAIVMSLLDIVAVEQAQLLRVATRCGTTAFLSYMQTLMLDAPSTERLLSVLCRLLQDDVCHSFLQKRVQAAEIRALYAALEILLDRVQSNSLDATKQMKERLLALCGTALVAIETMLPSIIEHSEASNDDSHSIPEQCWPATEAQLVGLLHGSCMPLEGTCAASSSTHAKR
jgi:hypothetical protein